jgi:transposase, IS30 family
MKSQHKHYRQLTQGQRYQIQALHRKGFSQRSIAEAIGVHHSSISRELKRNSSLGVYSAKTANQLKDKRKISAIKFRKSDESHAEILRNGLIMGWSPENMSARMRLEIPRIALSHTTIYRRIREDKANGGCLHKLLPRFGKTRCKGGKRKAGRSMIPARVDISQRPKIVEQRLRLGDWEGDTVYGQDASLVTLVERKSLLTLIGKVTDKTAETVSNMMINMLNRVGPVHTITLDNGGEFAQHEKVAKAIGAQTFFARPYASYQRGTNENTNGLIRRCWPKKMRMGSLDKQAVRDMELRLNMTPRKVLKGLTPIEVYTGRRVALIA